jgi:type I restriction enzyme S subunit
MVALRIDENIIDPLFVFAVLRSPDVQSQIKNLDVSGVIPHLKKSDFDKLILPYPEPPIQKEIGDFYFNLSCKIDLLHRQNKTLEAIAETLFRQWFIEEAQEDWEEGPLDDVISVKGGTTPSTKEPEYWDGDIHWTSPRDLSNHNSVFLFDTDRKITEKGLAQIGSGLLPIGTVLLSSRAPIGYLAITDIPVAINQGYIAIICDKSISNYFMYLWCKANMKEIKNAGNGSVFQEISKSNFKTLEIQIPSSRILDNFERAISPTFEKIKANQKQIQTLEKLRDTLLPKLMSGEVRVVS